MGKFKFGVEKRFFEFMSGVSSTDEEEMVPILRNIITDIYKEQDRLDMGETDFVRLNELLETVCSMVRMIIRIQAYIKYFDGLK